jgi:hypothetical protein
MKRHACAALFLLMTVSCRHAGDDSQARPIFDRLVAATSASDYEAFMAESPPDLRTKLPKAQFDSSAALLAPRFALKHETTFLGEVNQQGYEIYIYRLRFQDGSDDLLGTLCLKDGKVTGILFR